MPIFLILGGAGVALLLVFSKSGTKKASSRNSGIGGAHSQTSNVKAFPVGTIADSLSKIGTSIFGGSGTHSPVDPTIKSPGSMGDPLTGRIITSLDSPSPANNVPAPSQIVTQIDGYGGPSAAEESTVTPEQFIVDSGD